MELAVPHFVCLASGSGEDAFWGQLLVVVILAAAWGVYSLFRKHQARHRPKRRPSGNVLNVEAFHGYGFSACVGCVERRAPFNTQF
jgi:hypothetical protein